jgi:hypothetical protein
MWAIIKCDLTNQIKKREGLAKQGDEYTDFTRSA